MKKLIKWLEAKKKETEKKTHWTYTDSNKSAGELKAIKETLEYIKINKL